MRSPRSMASVRSHGGTPPSSPRNGSISSTAELGAGAEGGAEQVDQAEEPAGLVAHPGDEPLAALGVDLQPGLGEVLRHPLGHLAARAGVDLLARRRG